MGYSDKIKDQLSLIVKNSFIVNRRYLEDELLQDHEQEQLLEEIFDSEVRESEIKQLSSHFAPIFEDGNPSNVSMFGKTGTGKTMTFTCFMKYLSEACKAQDIPLKYFKLDLTTPRTCFRALNDLACLLKASKYFKSGVPLEEFMMQIENKLADYKGYLILFIDEVDNITTDRSAFMSFIIRRLPQKIPSKLVLVFASNKISWPDTLDPRVKSFFRVNQIFFQPYNAFNLRQILSIRSDKAFKPGSMNPGVIEKISAIASREHGDARVAIRLLAKSAELAQMEGTNITIEHVDKAEIEIENDRYMSMLHSLPQQYRAVMASIIEGLMGSAEKLSTGGAYDVYKDFCKRNGLRELTYRRFIDIISELDLYSLISSTIVSKGRYGRTRYIETGISLELTQKIYDAILRNLGINIEENS